MKKSEQKIRSFQEIAIMFSELYKSPIESLYQSLQSGVLENHWNSLLANIQQQNSRKMNINKQQFLSFAEMKAIYHHCFTGPSEPFAPPVESLYKQWTTDPTAATPIANETGHLYGDPAIHMQHLYKQFGLIMPPQYKNMPDHLGLQLEFLAFLLNEVPFSFVLQYVYDHFDWLPLFKNKLQTVSGSNFYVSVTEQLIQMIKHLRLALEMELENSIVKS